MYSTTAMRAAWFVAGATAVITPLAVAAAWTIFEVPATAGRFRDRMRMTGEQRAAEDELCAELEAKCAAIREAEERDRAHRREAARTGFRPDLLLTPVLRPEELSVTDLISELHYADQHAVDALGSARFLDDHHTTLAEYRMWSDHAMSLFSESLRRLHQPQPKHHKLTRADQLRLRVAIGRRHLGPPHPDEEAADRAGAG